MGGYASKIRPVSASPTAARMRTFFIAPSLSVRSGTWKLEGPLMGQQAHHEVRAEWVPNHQFLRLHEKTAARAPNTERPSASRTGRSVRRFFDSYSASPQDLNTELSSRLARWSDQWRADRFC